MFSSHPSEPMVNQRRLPDSSPGNDCNDVDILVCPCVIQESDILLSTKNVASGNGQSGYGNLLRCKSCWRLAKGEPPGEPRLEVNGRRFSRSGSTELAEVFALPV